MSVMLADGMNIDPAAWMQYGVTGLFGLFMILSTCCFLKAFPVINERWKRSQEIRENEINSLSKLASLIDFMCDKNSQEHIDINRSIDKQAERINELAVIARSIKQDHQRTLAPLKREQREQRKQHHTG